MAFVWLGLTILLELPFYVLARVETPFWRLGLACLIINGLTHPLATWAFLDCGFNWYWVEFAVVTTEMFLLRATISPRWVQSFKISLLANGFTAGLAWVINNLL